MKTYEHLNKVNCPYCGSIQVKAMARQPNKYPKPTDPSEFHDWQNGYDCKKCGSEFVAIQKEPSKSSIIGSLIKWAIVIAIIYAMFSWINNRHTSPTTSNKPDSIEEVIKEKEAQKPELKYNEGDPTPEAVELPNIAEVFSEDAEQAAHGEFPNDPTKSTESENLTITETTKETE